MRAVRYEVFVEEEDRYWSEDEISTKWSEFQRHFAKDCVDSGALVVRGADASEARLHDVLGAMVQNVCFRSLESLSMGRDVVVEGFSYEGQVELHVHAEETTVSGDGVEGTTVVPTKLLIESLYDCGLRYTETLRRLSGHERAVESLERDAEAAARVIRSPIDRAN